MVAEEMKGSAGNPSSLDPYADAMAEGLGALGIRVGDKTAITTARNWAKACGVELMAAFGPGAILMLLGRFGRHHEDRRAAKPEPKTARKESKPASGHAAASAPVKALPAALDDPIHSFIARRLERFEGAIMSAGTLWGLWRADCEQAGIPPGSQQAFGRQMKKWFAHEKNSGRPRYLNVREKVETASLRLAVSNA
jgi:hypothetical protein